MKKILTITLAIALLIVGLFVLTGCEGKKTGNTTANNISTKVNNNTTNTESSITSSISSIFSSIANSVVNTVTDVANTITTEVSNTINSISSKNESAEYNMSATKSNGKLIVRINGDDGLDYEKSPWVGIVPVGEYKNEEEADQYDETYTYVTAENYPNIELDLNGIEKGEWLVVLCDTDDNGKILATMQVFI